MERVLVFRSPREVDLVAYEHRAPGRGEVIVRTLYSGISAGTELTAYRGSNLYLNKRWDDRRRLWVDGPATFPYPVEGWGYEQVGEVVEVGAEVEAVRRGDVVWGIWGHRSSGVVAGEKAAERLLPEGVPPICGVFARIGAVALNAVLDADIHVGEVVAVFGQGVPGLLATQLARLNGGTVVAVDPMPRRLELARALGASHVVAAEESSPSETIKTLTDDRGADVSIEFSGAHAALHEAVRATAYGSRVVAAGFYQGEGIGLRLGEEFHQNRIELVASQIGGVSHRLARRWTTLRLERTVLELRVEQRLQLEPLVSHILPFEEAAAAFRLLDERPEEAVQVVLEFEDAR